MLFKNNVSVVTGGCGGIGEVIAITLAKEGSKVVIVDNNIEEGDKIARKIKDVGQEVMIVKIDITDESQVHNMKEKVLDKFNTIDILVNCAGVLSFSSVEKTSVEEWDKVLDVNLKGTFLCSQAVIGIMKEKKSGKIVNISSCAAKNWFGRASVAYTVSKAGVSNFTIYLAKELAEYGINVNAIAPGPTETKMTTSESYGKDALEKVARNIIPLRRPGKPEDIAKAVLFLSSNMSDYITGEILDVNGGLIMD